MRQFLPRIFRTKENKKENVRKIDNVAHFAEPEVDVKQKRAWTLKILKKHRNQRAAKRDMKVAPEVAMTHSTRRHRRPNMSTTQRKLAASQKRLRHLQQVADAKEEHVEGCVSRTRTFPSTNKLHAHPNEQERSSFENGVCVRRTKTGSAFLMNNEMGNASIEVEFTDEGEDLATGCRKGTRFPLTFKSLPPACGEEDIKVAWKNASSRAEDDSLPRLRTVLSGCSSTGTSLRDESKATEITEWESVAESTDEATAAWADFHREQMLAKLQGMKMEEAHESQDFMSKRALRIASKSQNRIPRHKGKPSCAEPANPATASEHKLSCC